MADISGYRHRQFGLWMCVVCGLGFAFVTATNGFGGVASILAASILVPIVLVFSTMTVSVNPERVEWWLTFGALRQRIETADVVSARIVHVGWLTGLGIRTNLRDWAWIVSGRTAVAITVQDGHQIVLGTDDSDGLLEAIDRLILAAPSRL